MKARTIFSTPNSFVAKQKLERLFDLSDLQRFIAVHKSPGKDIFIIREVKMKDCIQYWHLVENALPAGLFICLNVPIQCM